MVALRTLTLSALFTAAAGITAKVSEIQPHDPRPQASMTLRDWLKKDKCLNLALVPQYNNQHSIWGLLEFLRKDGLLEHLTGVSACSGGTLPGAFIAAGKRFSDFYEVFPKNGWIGFGPAEPKISEDYTNFLSAGLPKTFEELKIPFALSATHWDSEEALKTFVKAKSHEVVLSKGELFPAMMTAVATGNSGVIPDPKCPKCSFGFWPKKVGDMYPLTDGAFTDIWGTQGLVALPKCNRLMHVLPLDYPGQTKPQKPEQIPSFPKEVVTLIVTQPPIASHSYFQEGISQKLKSNPVGAQFIVTDKTTQEWNELMYGNARKALEKVVDSPMVIENVTDQSQHYTVLVDNGEILRQSENFKEKIYDAWMGKLRDNFWKFWGTQDGMGKEDKADNEEKPTSIKRISMIQAGKPKELGPPIELMEKR